MLTVMMVVIACAALLALLGPVGLIVFFVRLVKARANRSSPRFAILGIVASLIWISLTVLGGMLYVSAMESYSAPAPPKELPAGYTDASTEAHAYVMNHARKDFIPEGGTTKVDHIVFRRAIKTDIPRQQQKFGMTTILFVQSSRVNEGDGNFTYEVIDVFALDGNGAYPLSSSDAENWEIAIPSHEGWRAWTESIMDDLPNIGSVYSYLPRFRYN